MLSAGASGELESHNCDLRAEPAAACRGQPACAATASAAASARSGSR